MVQRFRADNPLSTQELLPAVSILQPTEHERMRDPYATMDFDDPDQTRDTDTTDSSSSSSSSTNFIPRGLIFDYPTAIEIRR